MKLKTITILVAASCSSGSIGALAMDMKMDMSAAKVSDQNVMWLKPLSREDVRAQRAKMKEMQKASGKSWGERSNGQTQHSKSADKKQKKGGASSYMRRIYSVRTSSFPEPMKMKGTMPHGNKPTPSTMENMVLWVKSPDNDVQMYKAKRRGVEWQVSYPSGDGGWYNMFAYNDLGVQETIRVHHLSFTSSYGHGEHADEVATPTIEGPGYYQGKPVLKLERICANHRECYRTSTGQTLRVRASFLGQPLANKELTFATQQGWKQTKRTDEQGLANFVIIKEDFPEDVDRRKAEDYLVTLKHETNDMGMLGDQHYHGERYIATLPLRVHPSPLDWESRSVAFQVLAGTVLVVGGGIAVRRKRKGAVS